MLQSFFALVGLVLKLLALGVIVGAVAGAALGTALFRQRDPRREESLARRLVVPYASVAGLTFGVMVALFAVPHSAVSRGWWLVVCVASCAAATIFAAGFAFDFNARLLAPGTSPKAAARGAGEDLRSALRRPLGWIRSKPALDKLCDKVASAAKAIGRRIRSAASDMRPPGTPKSSG